MFIFNLTYIKPITEVEKYLKEHLMYLDKNYLDNNFICSGRKNPRTGGIIICRADKKEEAEIIMKNDPFYINKIADYEIIEFIPSKYVDEIKNIFK